ncbi:MAG: terminase large subunit [Clostridiales bacterium]|nr:terminase large subunit [Clostridiales bacterium]
MFYEFLVDGLKAKTFVFDEQKANKAIEWIEKHCFHTEGPLAPKKLQLELWQKAMVSTIYGIVDKNGKRQFREIVFIVARKNGKSLLAAAIAKYEWQENGYGSRVYCLAPKLDQTDIIYNSVWQQTMLDPEYKALKKKVQAGTKDHERKKVDDSDLPKHRMTDLYIAARNSTVKKIAFSDKRSDGFNPSLTICDEIASWQGDKGLKMYEVMKSGMGAREMGENPALLLSCSTAGYVDGSIYDELIKRATRFLLGESTETRLAPFLYMVDDPEKWDDMEELKKSNPNLNVSVSEEYLKEEIAIANGSLSKKAEFLCKYCNVKQNSSLAWLEAQVVNAAAGDPLCLDDFRSSYCVAGIDLSQTTDLTSACVVIEKNGELYVFSKFWLPSERIDEATARDGVPYNIYIQRGLLDVSGENYVDYHDCFNWFRMLVEEYEILPLMVGYDRYSAQYLVQDLQGYGFRTDDVYQGENLWGVLQEMEGLMKDRKVHIGDNDLLKIHLLNSAIKMSVERGRGKLIKLNPSAHIDGCAALADAFTVRQKWYDEIGDRLRNET